MKTVEISAAARVIGILVIFIASIAPSSRGEGPSPATIESFDRYVTAAETQFHDELIDNKNSLYIDALPEAERTQSYAALRRGQLLIRRSPPCEPRCPASPGGLLHDWTAIVFVSGVTLAETLAALQDYDRDAAYYQPQVTSAKLLSRSANHFRVFLRLQQTHVITVVLDTEYEIQYITFDNSHAASQSHSTRIQKWKMPAPRKSASSLRAPITDSCGVYIPTGASTRPMAASTSSATPSP